MQAILPPEGFTTLSLLSQVGVILFMFGVGLDLDTSHLRRRAATAVAVSHVSIAAPFLLGVSAALACYPRYAPPGVPFAAFAFFMGIALSLTAFPVLARILEERHLTDTPLGATVLACAAVDDLTAWTLLAMVVTLVTSGGVGATVGGIPVAAAFLATGFWIVRPLARWADTVALTPVTALAPAVILLLAAASTAEAIGIHALFGAFVAGLVMPRDPALRRGCAIACTR
jgi:Kef-type K+ transport system membrane component KefB